MATLDMMNITRRYYNAESGASQLLQELIKNSKEIESTAVPFVYLGDSRRENLVETHADPVEHKGICIKNWIIGSNKSHITPLECMDQYVYWADIMKLNVVFAFLCRIGEEAKLTPPEMVFGGNQLLLLHQPTGICYTFLAVEALKGAHFNAVDSSAQQQLKVSVAKVQSNKEDVKELDITYDWTYTTDYKGTLQRLVRAADSNAWSIDPNASMRTELTNERINVEKLKEREPILWFDEVNLFEDELHDHGVSVMSIKVRVMPSGFYVLARYWLRLDHVVVRLYESRVHHVFGSNYLLREYTRKEASFDELIAQGHPKSMAHYTNIDTFQHLLPLRESVYEKIWLE